MFPMYLLPLGLSVALAGGVLAMLTLAPRARKKPAGGE